MPASQIMFASWPQVYNPNPGVLQCFTRVTLLEKLNVNQLVWPFLKKSHSQTFTGRWLKKCTIMVCRLPYSHFLNVCNTLKHAQTSAGIISKAFITGQPVWVTLKNKKNIKKNIKKNQIKVAAKSSSKMPKVHCLISVKNNASGELNAQALAHVDATMLMST